VLVVYSAVDCDPTTQLYNTTVSVPTLDGSCQSVANSSAYSSATCFSADSNSKKKSKSCFAGTETVQLSDGTLKQLADVAIGDSILGVDSFGSTSFSPVVIVPHGYNNVRTKFVVLTTETGEDLRLTPDHLIFAATCNSAAHIASYQLTQAKDVRIGDCLLQPHWNSLGVVSISVTVGRGAYTVITDNEYMIVNGFIASPYAVNHAVANLYYSLYRALCKLLPAAVMKHFWLREANEFLGLIAGKITSN
jgi:hypothetical protein